MDHPDCEIFGADGRGPTARALRPLPSPVGAFGYWGLTPVAVL